MRDLDGYYRYNTPTELETLTQIWALDDAFANYFLPNLKLASKHRDGTKVVKKYHQAATPHQRTLAHPATSKRTTIQMNTRYKKLRLDALQLDWTAIGFVDGSEKLGLWFRLPSWFSSIPDGLRSGFGTRARNEVWSDRSQ